MDRGDSGDSWVLGGSVAAPWKIAAGAAMASGGVAVGVHALTGQLFVALGLLLLLGMASGWLASRWLVGRASLRPLQSTLRRLAQGDLDARFAAGADEALRELAPPIESLALRLGAGRQQLAALSSRLETLPGQLAIVLDDAERSAVEQEAAVEETASLLANINASIKGINAEVENLARSNEETAASIEQMSTAIEQVASTADALQQTVASSTSSIQRMGASIRQVAESGDEVQQVANETATATTEMDRAIQEVGEHVRGASALTRRVSERAEAGSEAVGETIRGIEAIRRQTLAAKSALEALAVRIGEIGEIATVIGGISEETNLLSLNAAIIAVQAGEHGKAFAVVAGQVKKLSQRTSASARQIGEMIQGVQTESANAVRAMGSGIAAVQEGVARSRVAGEALEVIRSSAREANGQVSEITRATEEQARNSKHVASAAQRVSEHVRRISAAMSEQSAASESFARNANTYLDMARQMAQATEEQRISGRYIAGNSHAITEMIRSIQANTAAHERASQAVSERCAILLQNAHGAAAQIARIDGVADQLRREAATSVDADASNAEHSAA